MGVVLGTERYRTPVQSVVPAQHVIQRASDLSLGRGGRGSHAFHLHQLRDMKAASALATVGTRTFVGRAGVCASALAQARARSGDPAAIAEHVGSGSVFEAALSRFVVAYDDQTTWDGRALRHAVARGHLAAMASHESLAGPGRPRRDAYRTSAFARAVGS